jgi:ribosomal protein L1
MSEGSDVDRAREDLENAQQQLAELEESIKAETEAIAAKFDPSAETLDKVTVRPKKADIRVDAVVLAWTPHWVDASGAKPAWA